MSRGITSYTEKLTIAEMLILNGKTLANLYEDDCFECVSCGAVLKNRYGPTEKCRCKLSDLVVDLSPGGVFYSFNELSFREE